MSGAAATAAPAETPAAPQEATPEPVAGAKPPADPEKRARLQRKAAVRRLVGKLADAEDTDAVWKKIDALAVADGRKVSKPATGEPAPAAVVAIDPKAIAKWEPAARQLWEGVGQVLGAVSLGLESPTVGKFAAAMQVHDREIVGPDEKPMKVTVDPIAMLASPTAKVAAKYLPEVASGPEAELAGAIAAVFVPVAVAIAFEAMGRKLKAGDDAPAKEGDAPRVKAAA